MKRLLTNYYSRTYRRWRVDKEKAGKDIVGEEYELMRKKFWTQQGFKAKKEKIGGYAADLVVRTKAGKVVVIEEDKAHYVDSCFLDRFVMNAGRVLQHYIDLKTHHEDIPFVSLSKTLFTPLGLKFLYSFWYPRSFAGLTMRLINFIKKLFYFLHRILQRNLLLEMHA